MVVLVLTKAAAIAGAAAACLIMAAASLPSLAGYKTMIVTGGSMEPSISVGDAALLESVGAEEIRPGEVITFRPLGGPHRLTSHRAIGVKIVGGRTHFQTKGDANRTPDPNLVPADNVLGLVRAHIPYLGYILYYATIPAGRAVLMVFPALVIAVLQIRAIQRWRRENVLRRLERLPPPVEVPSMTVPRAVTRVGAGLLLAVLTVFLTVAVMDRSAAIYSSTANVGGSSFSTATLAAPTSLAAGSACDGVGVAKADLTWSVTGSVFADGYDVYRGTGSGGPYAGVGHANGRGTTSFSDTGLATNTTYYFVIKATASNWVSVYSNETSVTTPASCP